MPLCNLKRLFIGLRFSNTGKKKRSHQNDYKVFDYSCAHFPLPLNVL